MHSVNNILVYYYIFYYPKLQAHIFIVWIEAPSITSFSKSKKLLIQDSTACKCRQVGLAWMGTKLLIWQNTHNFRATGVGIFFMKATHLWGWNMTKSSSAWQVPISESATFHPVKYSIANLPKNIIGLSKKRSTVVIEPTCEYI